MLKCSSKVCAWKNRLLGENDSTMHEQECASIAIKFLMFNESLSAVRYLTGMIVRKLLLILQETRWDKFLDLMFLTQTLHTSQIPPIIHP